MKTESNEFRYGDLVQFIEPLIRNNKIIAKKGDSGKIVAFNGSWNGITTVKINRKKYATLEVPTSILYVLSTLKMQ